MLQRVLMGTAAGAAGTAALNIATYLDMVIRGRPASQVPAEDAAALAGAVGIDLSGNGQGQQAREKVSHRKTGLGALLGYLTGLGIGTAYGLLRPRLGKVGRLAPLVAGPTLGLTAMAAADVPSVLLGKTNPKTWGVSGWLADIVPHLAYGVVTALTYEAAYPAVAQQRRSLFGVRLPMAA